MAGLLWGIYVRISDDRREGAKLGVKRQTKDIRPMIARTDPGGVVVDVYVDNDLTAYKGKPRKDYIRMCADIRSGRINAIGAWHNDRLHRPDLRELEDFIDLIEGHGSRVATVKAGDMDLSTATGRLIARQLGIIARFESEHKAERIRAKHAELAADGKPHGGGERSYGLQPIYDRPELPHKLLREEVIPEEAERIREWAKRALQGESLYAITAGLNEHGITTASGGPWYRTSLARVLTSAKIAGLREHRGVITGPGKWADGSLWPQIITPEQSRQLRRLLLDPARRTSPGPTGRWLCTGGLLVCGHCGKPMVGRGRASPHADSYICHPNEKRGNCGRMSIPARETDLVITTWVSDYLPGPVFQAAVRRVTTGPDEDILHSEITAAERKRTELSEDYAADRMTRSEWMAAREVTTARIERARRQLAPSSAAVVLNGIPTDSAGIQAFLLDADIPTARRRAVIKAVLVKVTVKPAARTGRQPFDPGRLDPEWRA